MSVFCSLRTLAARRRELKGRSVKQRAIRFFEQLEERQVLSVTWGVQSDFFGTRDVVSQPRSLRGLALSGDEQHVYTGFIQGTTSSAIRETSAGINANLIGNGAPGSPFGVNPVYSTGLEASVVTIDQPRGLATDDRGNVYATLNAPANQLSQIWGIYPANLAIQLSSESSSNNISTSQISGMATAKLGGDYYAYIGWRNGLIERWNVNDPSNPILDTSWGAAGTPGKISLKSITTTAYLNNLEVDTDGTIFVAGGLQGTTSSGDALIKIPAAAAAVGNLATATSVNVQGGASGAGGFAAMDVALYAGKAYVTQYLASNSTVSSFYTLDLSFAGNVTPPTTLAGPSTRVSDYGSGADSGFSGIDISSDGRIYLADQIYSFVPSTGSYTPPGGVAMTGTRIYFDRVLVSTALDVDGPVTSLVTADPNPALAGASTLITLTANVNDTSSSGSTIASAEYSVDGGTNWLPMTPADGVFDEVSEDVTVQFTLGAAGFILPDSYTLLVRGKDTANQTGASSSTILVVNGTAPTIDSADSTTFTVGTFGTFTVETTATPTAEIDITGSLPDGVSFVDNGDGTATLSGTPAVGEGGTFSFTITASNGIAPDDTQSFTLTINEAPLISSANTTTFTVLEFGSFTITTADHFPSPATITFTGTLPSGVNLVDNGDGTATLSGTPGFGTQGSYTLNLTADNGVAPAGTQSFTLVVNPPPVDYGDAPDSYGTVLASEGARHSALGPKLGVLRDIEADGQPGTAADVDGADEDGVLLPASLIARLNAEITVTSDALSRLDAWIDFNRNGVFEASEQIANGRNILPGSNTFTIAVPANVNPGTSYARFRLSSFGGLSPTGPATDGEVEDYAVTLAVPAFGSIAVVDDPENPGSGVLLIRGTNNFYETISVQPTAGQPGKVTASISPGSTVAGIDLSTFDRIVIFGEGGFDQISVAAAITKPATIYGDDGFDTINGGGGNDIIYGGPSYDSLNGNGGDDTFVNEGGADGVNGGAGFDTIVKQGSGTFNLSSYAVSAGGDYISTSSIEKARLVGGAGADIFNFTGWNGAAEVDGGGGVNTIVDSADGTFVLNEGQLTRTLGANTVTIQFTNVTNAQLTGGFGNNAFDLSAWPNTAVIDGGFFGTDNFTVAGDVNYTLSAAMLTRPSLGQIRLAGMENATLTGGESDNTFDVTNWTSAATLNGLGGTDKLIAGGNVNMTLTDTSLTRTSSGGFSFTGPGGPFTLSSIEQADLTGGAGNNTISAADFSGEVKINGGDGNDTLTSGSGIAILLGGAGNDILNAGSGRTVMIGGLGTDTLNGGSNDDLQVDGTTIYDNNAAILALILAEWASTANYNDRVAHLTGTSGGLNGSFHLGGNNVVHDANIDTLMGGLGDDLFFAKLDVGNTDILSDKTGAESAI